MGQEDRKHFEEWQVHIVYMQQEGRCANCQGSLDYGMGTGKPFEKHHANNNHADNSLENLELLCKTCHMATLAQLDKDYKKRYDEYQIKKKEIFDRIVSLTEKAIGKELAGSVITATIELLSMQEKGLAEMYGMNQGVFYAPPSVRAMVNYKNMMNELEAYKEGIKIGLSTISNIVHRSDKT